MYNVACALDIFKDSAKETRAFESPYVPVDDIHFPLLSPSPTRRIRIYLTEKCRRSAHCLPFCHWSRNCGSTSSTIKRKRNSRLTLNDKYLVFKRSEKRTFWSERFLLKQLKRAKLKFLLKGLQHHSCFSSAWTSSVELLRRFHGFLLHNTSN